MQIAAVRLAMPASLPLLARAVSAGFGNNLKQQGVNAEERAELLGHGGDNETTERYCDNYEQRVLHDAVPRLPVVTGHLAPTPLRFLPRVEAKRTAPFSHPGRKGGEGTAAQQRTELTDWDWVVIGAGDSRSA